VSDLGRSRDGWDRVPFFCANRTEPNGWERLPIDLGVMTGGVVDALRRSGLSIHGPDDFTLEFFAPPV